MNQPANTEVPTLRYRDIAERLGVTERTVWKYTNDGTDGQPATFPCSRTGSRFVRFSEEQAGAIVETWSKMQARPA